MVLEGLFYTTMIGTRLIGTTPISIIEPFHSVALTSYPVPRQY